MWNLGTPALELVFLVALRLFGKREIGQFTPFDLALVLLVANALQPAITGPDNSLLGGLILVATLFVLNRLIAFLRDRSRLVRRLLDFGPTVVGRNGHWVIRELARQGLDLVDVQAALREHGLDEVGQMKLATLKSDGSISIVAIDSGQDGQASHRRRRYRRPQ